MTPAADFTTDSRRWQALVQRDAGETRGLQFHQALTQRLQGLGVALSSCLAASVDSVFLRVVFLRVVARGESVPVREHGEIRSSIFV